MSSRNLVNGDTILGRYGSGNDSRSPELGRWLILYNNTGKTMFIPENSAAERESVYENFPYAYRADSGGRGYGVTSTKKLYNNVCTNGLQNGSGCSHPHTNQQVFVTPGACPSGYTDEGILYVHNANALNQNGQTGVKHGNVEWMFYIDQLYGCPSPFLAKYAARQCTRTAANLGFV